MTRVYFENIDGFRIQPRGPIHNNNDKIKYYNTMTTRLETDIICGVEARTNWSILPKNYQLSNLLQTREGARVITAHNVHEQFSIPQQGGTFLVAKEQCQGMIESMGKDESGLGRWCWIKLRGTTTSTRIIVAYEACRTRKTAQNATMAQQRRYWRTKGDKRCPRKIFREQLIKTLHEWKEEGDKLILFIDSNEDMEQGILQKIVDQTINTPLNNQNTFMNIYDVIYCYMLFACLASIYCVIDYRQRIQLTKYRY